MGFSKRIIHRFILLHLSSDNKGSCVYLRFILSECSFIRLCTWPRTQTGHSYYGYCKVRSIYGGIFWFTWPLLAKLLVTRVKHSILIVWPSALILWPLALRIHLVFVIGDVSYLWHYKSLFILASWVM